jgi:hypothetical protein
VKFRCGLLVAGLTLLLAACATAPPPPPPDPAFAALGLRSVAVGPVLYATYQPGEHCSAFIDEEVRSALVRELRRRGYDAFAAGNSVPRSFAAGTPAPLPGDPPPVGPLPSPGVQGVLEVWIEEYFENSLCGWEGPKYLTMGAVAVLYAGSPPVEVWRGRARAAEHGYYPANNLIWLTTLRLSDGLLQPLPAGPGWSGAR